MLLKARKNNFFPVLLSEVSIYWEEAFSAKYQTMNPWANVNTRQEDKIYPCVYFKHLLQIGSQTLFFCLFFFFLKYLIDLQSFPTDNWVPSCTLRKACKQKGRVSKTLTCCRAETGLISACRQEAKSQNTKENWSHLNSENSHQRWLGVFVEKKRSTK